MSTVKGRAQRGDARAGLSGCVLERKYNVGRRTVVKALTLARPKPRKMRHRGRRSWARSS